MNRSLSCVFAFLVLPLLAACPQRAPVATADGEGAPSRNSAIMPADGGAACASQLPHGQVPTFDNPKLTQRSTLICHPSMAVLASGLTRTGLWSAEYLDPARIQATRRQSRNNTFHPEAALAPADRAELADYVRSGYDRGHLSPSADQPSPATQDDSFSLANMAPQNPGLNRGPWEHLEVAVRRYAEHQAVYVITGVQVQGAQVQLLNRRVVVPTQFYKLIYDPARRTAVVYEADNIEGGQPQPYVVADYERARGIHFGLGAVAPMTLTLPTRGGADRD